MKSEKSWRRWVLQTALTWEDMKFVIKETGIAHIDHEHKRMTDYMVEINRLLFELDKSFSIEVYTMQKKLMNSFYIYTVNHCANEESFIKKYNIPGLELQEKEHKRLLSLIKEILFEYDTGRVTSAFRHRVKLLNLIVNHINGVDNRVFKFSNISKNLIKIANWSEINTFIRLIHVPLIDKQHKVLTEMIIDILKLIDETVIDNKVSEETLEKFRLIKNYAALHFRTETSIIKSYNIPDLETQDKQHELFLNFLEEKYSDLENSRIETLDDIKGRLLLWWINHINIYDYRTFRTFDWLKPILLKSSVPDDVNWLIAKMGIKEVDDDHLHFIDILFKNLKIFDDDGNQEKSVREQGLLELYKYAVEHFEREEHIMLKKGVLDREQHIFEHKSILKTLRSFNDLNKGDKVNMSSAFKRKILSIWITHINDTDAGTFGVSYE